jgi:hypothetical protein
MVPTWHFNWSGTDLEFMAAWLLGLLATHYLSIADIALNDLSVRLPKAPSFTSGILRLVKQGWLTRHAVLLDPHFCSIALSVVVYLFNSLSAEMLQKKQIGFIFVLHTHVNGHGMIQNIVSLAFLTFCASFLI